MGKDVRRWGTGGGLDFTEGSQREKKSGGCEQSGPGRKGRPTANGGRIGGWTEDSGPNLQEEEGPRVATEILSLNRTFEGEEGRTVVGDDLRCRRRPSVNLSTTSHPTTDDGH